MKMGFFDLGAPLPCIELQTKMLTLSTNDFNLIGK